MGWISWLCPGINLKRWLLLFAVGVLLCALGLALFFNYQLMGKAEELLFQMTYLTTGRYSNTLIMAMGVLFLVVGFGVMIYGTRRLISSVVSVVIPDKSGSLMETIFMQRKLTKGPAITVVGGGTGLSTLLRGMKYITNNCTAVVTSADDGGSSGRLRKELGIIPPGDLRNCLTALADREPLMERVMQYRFKGDSPLAGHCFGNLFIAAMAEAEGGMEAGLNATSQILKVRGRVIPSALANIQVQGNIINNVGDVNITSDHNNIVVQGETVQAAVAITGKEVNLYAGGSVIQGYTDGIVHIGGSPQLTYKDLYDQLKQDHNTVNQGYPTPDYGSVGSYIAGGAVYINATDINVNGVIQSGYANYYVDIIGSDVENKINSLQSNYNSSSGTISDHVITSGDTYKIINGGAVWDSGAGAYKYQLNVYYNPSTNKIVVEDIDANGGQIYLTGRISSTGNGKIVCLDGLSNISVNNKLDYVMQLGDLTVNETSGLVKITDTAGGFNHGAAVRVTTVTK